MKTISRIIAVLATLGFSSVAFAGDITYTPADCDGVAPDAVCWTSDQNAMFDEQDLAANFGGLASDYTLQYKSNRGGTEESTPFADSYETTYSLGLDTNYNDAEIKWDGAPDPAIACTAADPCYVGVKDGNASPNIYVFELTDWDGMGSIFFKGFFFEQGSISNVTIWNGTTTTTMPEPGTLALLGLGLFGMGLMRRRRTS